MDVLENLILLMIIRREVIHFAIKYKNTELLGTNDKFLKSAINSVNNSGFINKEMIKKEFQKANDISMSKLID